MKTTLFALCFLCTTTALGQSGIVGQTLTSQPQVIQMYSHPEHASQQPMAREQNLLEKTGLVYDQGTRPLWEVAPVHTAVPLGDTARMLRKQRETAKKAVTVLED